MEHNLIIEKTYKIPFLNYSKFNNIYAYASLFNKLHINNKINQIIITDELFTVTDWLKCDHKSSLIADTVLGAIAIERDMQLLSEISDVINTDSLIKKHIIVEVAKVFYSFHFAEKIKRAKKIQGTCILIPNTFSYLIYKILRNMNLLPEDIIIPSVVLFRLKAQEFARNIYSFYKIIFYPEFFLHKMKWKGRGDQKKTYKYGVYVSGGESMSGHTGIRLFIDGKDVKKNDVLFVLDNMVEDNNIRDIKNASVNYVCLYTDFIMRFSSMNFISNYYLLFNKIRMNFIVLCIKHTIFTTLMRTVFFDYILWNLFYEQFKINKFIFMMLPPNLIRSGILRKKGSESIFIYHSVTTPTIDRNNNPDKTEIAYYSYMLYDKVISDRVSNLLFQTYENEVQEYINNGSLLSDVVFKVKRSEARAIRNKLGVKKNGYLISFFDQNVGPRCCFTYKDEHMFLESIRKLLLSNDSYYIALRLKTNAILTPIPENKAIINLYNSLKKHERFICASELELTSYKLMGASDVVVSGVLSSVTYQALSGGIKSISYDPNARYSEEWFLHEQLPNISAHNHEELSQLIKYWLNDCSDDEFQKFQNEYIKTNFDDYCDGKAMERFRKLLAD